MKFKRQIIMLLVTILVGSACSCLFSQGNEQTPTRQSSMEAFSKGDYEKAYKEFNQLLQKYSKDPLYKYYCGACLVELRRSPGEALNLLEQSLRSATAVRALPPDAYFYYGRAQQMNGKYEEAIKSFNIFTEEAGKKAAREKGTADFVQQCRESRGEIKEATPTAAISETNDTSATLPVISKATSVEVAKQNAPAITEKQNPPVNYEKIIDQAMEYQFMADSLRNHIILQKKELDSLSGSEKTALQNEIENNEKLAASYQKSADLKSAQAMAAADTQKVIVREEETAIQKPVIIVATDSVKGSVKDTLMPVAAKADETVKPATEQVKAVEVFSLFAIMPRPGSDKTTVKKADSEFHMDYHFQGKDWWDPTAKIEIDPVVPATAGLIYRIQLAVFRSVVAPSYFMGIAPVYGFKIAGTDKTIYYAGMFRRSSDAGKALSSVKAKGFTDAFVVALSENKKVPADKATVMEKEWGNVPFISAAWAPVPNETTIDTIPPALSFRVEVVRSKKPLKEDVIEGMKKIAGVNGVDTRTFDDKSTAYLIGKFITFESAAEYSDLLIKNGYRDAHVVAFLGTKEIPVETARQLFDSTK